MCARGDDRVCERLGVFVRNNYLLGYFSQVNLTNRKCRKHNLCSVPMNQLLTPVIPLARRPMLSPSNRAAHAKQEATAWV